MKKTWKKIKGSVRSWFSRKADIPETNASDSYCREVSLEIPMGQEGVDLELVKQQIMQFPYVVPYSEPKMSLTAEGMLQLTVELFDSRQAGKLREKLVVSN